MRIAEAYVELRTKGDKAKADAKGIVDDIGKSKPKPIEVDADTKPAQDELGKLEQTSKTKGQAIAGNLARLFTAGIFVDQIGKAIGAASNLEQAVGGTKAVFQESSGVIDRWAENSADKFGLSERAFREATSQIGAQLKGYGLSIDEAAQKSVELTGLGGDLAATFGGTVADAVGALGSTLRGEFDPAERYGIALSAAKVEAKALELGLVGLDGKMTASGKVQATLALITEQTADAQGQFAREADTAGGQTERLKAKFEDMQAEIGSNLLPVFSRVVSMLSTVTKFFGDLPGPVQTAIVAMAGIVIVAGPIKKVVGLLTDVTTQIRNVAKTAGGAGPALAGFAGALLAFQAYQQLGEGADYARESVGGLTVKLSEGATKAQAAKAQLDEMVASVDGLAEVFAAAGVSTDVLGAAAVTNGPEFGKLAQQLYDTARGGGFTVDAFEAVLRISDKFPGQLAKATAATKDTEQATGAISEAFDGLFKSSSDASAGVEEVKESITGLPPGIDGVRESIESAGSAAETLADQQLAALEGSADDAAAAADDLAKALDDVFGDAVDLQGAADQLAQNFDDLEQSIKDNGKSLDVNTEKGRANREQLRTSVQGVQEYITKLAESGATSDEVATQYAYARESLVRQAEQFGLTREDAEKYVDQLGLTPESVTTAVNLAGVEPAREQIRQHIERVGAIPTGWNTIINAAADRGDIDAVERALEHLRRDRIARIRVSITGGGGGSSVGDNIAVAEGGFFRGGTVADKSFSLAEIPGRRGDEAVLPLGNRGRLRQLLASPEIGPRVREAMGEGAGGSVAVLERPSAGVSVGTINVGSRDDLRGVNDAFDELLWRVRVGG